MLPNELILAIDTKRNPNLGWTLAGVIGLLNKLKTTDGSNDRPDAETKGKSWYLIAWGNKHARRCSILMSEQYYSNYAHNKPDNFALSASSYEASESCNSLNKPFNYVPLPCDSIPLCTILYTYESFGHLGINLSRDFLCIPLSQALPHAESNS